MRTVKAVKQNLEEYSPDRCIPKLLVSAAAGARSVPERGACDWPVARENGWRSGPSVTAADGDRPRSANNLGMHGFPIPRS